MQHAVESHSLSGFKSGGTSDQSSIESVENTTPSDDVAVSQFRPRIPLSFFPTTPYLSNFLLILSSAARLYTVNCGDGVTAKAMEKGSHECQHVCQHASQITNR